MKLWKARYILSLGNGLYPAKTIFPPLFNQIEKIFDENITRSSQIIFGTMWIAAIHLMNVLHTHPGKTTNGNIEHESFLFIKHLDFRLSKFSKQWAMLLYLLCWKENGK